MTPLTSKVIRSSANSSHQRNYNFDPRNMVPDMGIYGVVSHFIVIDSAIKPWVIGFAAWVKFFHLQTRLMSVNDDFLHQTN